MTEMRQYLVKKGHSKLSSELSIHGRGSALQKYTAWMGGATLGASSAAFRDRMIRREEYGSVLRGQSMLSEKGCFLDSSNPDVRRAPLALQATF